MLGGSHTAQCARNRESSREYEDRESPCAQGVCRYPLAWDAAILKGSAGNIPQSCEALRPQLRELQPIHLIPQKVGSEVRIDQRHLEIAVSQDLLQRQDVPAGHYEVTGKGVSKCMPWVCQLSAACARQ